MQNQPDKFEEVKKEVETVQKSDTLESFGDKKTDVKTAKNDISETSITSDSKTSETSKTPAKTTNRPPPDEYIDMSDLEDLDPKKKRLSQKSKGKMSKKSKKSKNGGKSDVKIVSKEVTREGDTYLESLDDLEPVKKTKGKSNKGKKDKKGKGKKSSSSGASSRDDGFTTSGVFPVVSRAGGSRVRGFHSRASGFLSTSRGFHSLSRVPSLSRDAFFTSRDIFTHRLHTKTPLNQDIYLTVDDLKPQRAGKTRVKGKKPRQKKSTKKTKPAKAPKPAKGSGLKKVKLAHLEKEKEVNKPVFEEVEEVIEKAENKKVTLDKATVEVRNQEPRLKTAPNDNGEMFKQRFDQELEQAYFPVGSEWENHPKASAAISVPPELLSSYCVIEKNADEYVRLLGNLVSCPAVARHALEGRMWPFYRLKDQIFNKLALLGFYVKTPKLVPSQSHSDNPLPFLLVQPRAMDYQRPTVLVYLSYDTVHAYQSEWTQDPFTLGRKDGLLYGRGVSSKAAAAVWLSALHALKESKIEPSVNLKFCFDPFGELGHPALAELLEGEEAQFFNDIDACVVAEGEWMTNSQPNIVYGQRGVHNFRVSLSLEAGTLTNPEKRIDAGKYAGSVKEPLVELTHLLATLTSLDQGQILPKTETKIDFGVADVNEEETRQIGDLAVSEQQLKSIIGVNSLKNDTLAENVQNIWREPALSIHTIKHSPEPEAAHPVSIPTHATAEFSIRTVPNMDVDAVNYIVEQYVLQHHAQMKSRSKLAFECVSASPWWLASRDHWNYRSAARAIKSVWQVDPAYSREGGSSVVPSLLERRTGASVLGLPLGKPSDAVRTVAENFDEVNYVNGIKTVATYLFHAGKMSRTSDDFLTVETPAETKEKEHVSKLGDLIPVKKREKTEEEKPKKTVKNPQALSSAFVDRKVEKHKQLYAMKRVVIVADKVAEKKQVDGFLGEYLDELIVEKERVEKRVEKRVTKVSKKEKKMTKKEKKKGKGRKRR